MRGLRLKLKIINLFFYKNSVIAVILNFIYIYYFIPKTYVSLYIELIYLSTA